MARRRSKISILITDESIGFFQLAPVLEKSEFGFIALEKGIVEYGYIKDPNSFLSKIRTLFKAHKIKPSHIELIIHDQNLLIREMEVSKEELSRKSIESFISDQQNKTIHFPFENPVFSHYIKSETDKTLTILALICDESLLQDYHDVFDHVGVKEVTFDLSSISLYQLYNGQSTNKPKNAMIVSLFEHMLTIQIVDEFLPVFSMNEEIDESMEKYGEMVESYVERIANYYKYNIMKGKEDISCVLIFNFAPQMPESYLNKAVIPQLSHLKASLINVTKNEPFLRDLPTECQIAYACCLNNDDKSFKLKIKLDRIKKINFYSNYIMVLSFAVFSVTALIYIPYAIGIEEINIQRSINNILQNQLDTLIRDIPEVPVFSTDEINYSESYDFLSDAEYLSMTPIVDMTSKITGSLEWVNYHVNHDEKKITIVLSSASESELYEYLLEIYEQYGVITGSSDPDRWMVSAPTQRFISELVMEVTVYYA